VKQVLHRVQVFHERTRIRLGDFRRTFSDIALRQNFIIVTNVPLTVLLAIRAIIGIGK
jgi:hypothetical protein